MLKTIRDISLAIAMIFTFYILVTEKTELHPIMYLIDGIALFLIGLYNYKKNKKTSGITFILISILIFTFAAKLFI